jgi:hypothetical protein
LALLAIVFIVALCLVAGPAMGRRGAALFYERTMGNKDHLLSCGELTVVEVVEQTLANHQDVVDRIQQVNPGQIMVYADNSRCPGKADIVILFATVEDSRAIRRIIGKDTFFGIPYRMYNT